MHRYAHIDVRDRGRRIRDRTQIRQVYRPKSVHREPDEFVPVRPGRIHITLYCSRRFFLVCISHFSTTDR